MALLLETIIDDSKIMRKTQDEKMVLCDTIHYVESIKTVLIMSVKKVDWNHLTDFDL